jgi:hypothetical protein
MLTILLCVKLHAYLQCRITSDGAILLLVLCERICGWRKLCCIPLSIAAKLAEAWVYILSESVLPELQPTIDHTRDATLL